MDRYKQRRGILDDVPAFNPVPSYLGALADAVRGESVGGQLNAINAQQTQDAYRRHGLMQQEEQRQMAAQQQAAQAAESRRRFELTHGLAKQRLNMAINQGPRVMNVGGTLVRVGADGKPEVLYQPSADPLDRQIKQERLRKLQRGDPLADMKTRLLGQLLGGDGQPQAQPQGGVQLQSDEVTATDPRLIQTQTAEGQPQEQPQQLTSPLSSLSQEERQGMALNMVTPGLGNALIAKGQEDRKSAQYGQPAKNNVETKILNAEEHYSRLKEINTQFDPQFLSFAGRAKGAWFKLKDKLNMGQLNPEEATYLQRFSQFRQSSARNINLYIKEITGAQMSNQEADRIRMGEADFGEGLFDGDSPVEFKAKLDNSLRYIQLSRMRYHYLRSGGFNGTMMSAEDIGKAMKSNRVPISLPQMRNIYNQRHKQNLQMLKRQNPRASQQSLDQQAIAQTNRDLGI